jgi:hypothetical protein
MVVCKKFGMWYAGREAIHHASSLRDFQGDQPRSGFGSFASSDGGWSRGDGLAAVSRTES